jgi:hypothetical protein
MTELFIYEFELFKKSMYMYWAESFTRHIHDDILEYRKNEMADLPSPSNRDKYIYYPTDQLDESCANDFQEQVFGWNNAIEAMRSVKKEINEHTIS